MRKNFFPIFYLAALICCMSMNLSLHASRANLKLKFVSRVELGAFWNGEEVGGQSKMTFRNFQEEQAAALSVISNSNNGYRIKLWADNVTSAQGNGGALWLDGQAPEDDASTIAYTMAYTGSTVDQQSLSPGFGAELNLHEESAIGTVQGTNPLPLTRSSAHTFNFNISLTEEDQARDAKREGNFFEVIHAEIEAIA